MDAEGFPTFTESGFYREWLRSQLIFPDQTEEQKRHLLELAFYIYQDVRNDWSSSQLPPADGTINRDLEPLVFE